MGPVLHLGAQMYEWHLFFKNSHEDVADILVTLYSIYPMVAPRDNPLTQARPGWKTLESLILRPLNE